MITRRDVLAMGGFVVGGSVMLPRVLRAETSGRFRGLPASLAQLEKANAGRLGVAVFDTGSGERSGYRVDERFAMCSTFKMLLAAAVLQRVDAGREHLDRAVAIPAKPLVHYSPLTEEHAGGSMTVAELCHAILTRSDNTAANLLLDTLGGPGGITRFARSIGDTVTRLDRTETSLNEALPGDPRDTTSPAAMVGNLRAVLLGDVLSAAMRNQLVEWMVANKTGDNSLRAGLPHDWRVGDKTGSNGETTTNDIAILWPVNRKPVLVTAYLTECAGPEEKRKAVLAEVGRLVAVALQAG
ncbi:class A beta-lactamase [Granulicella arctica]|uniref:Beta-lactamase n=1 Tax=Granulicella arctica TaxID=940613 RepID=A0A7Y9PK71_9BACT|nr:class A beta-lactamase [Granulicella arctica]NYF81361.1 beta-lactamase class A [Granulicella arctica]